MDWVRRLVKAGLTRQKAARMAKPTHAVALSIPFQIGRTYQRQKDIHHVFGGQQRGGIATPADVPYIFLFTGQSGEQYGYKDLFTEDGIFVYTGEGQSGDVKFSNGNKAGCKRNGRMFRILPWEPTNVPLKLLTF